MEVDISPPDSPFHGFSADEVPQPIQIKTELSSPPESPFHGYLEDDIPRPIFIKTETVEGDNDEDDVIVVEVSRGNPPVLPIKQEIVEEEDDVEVFHGFEACEIPKPIFIKDEPDDITVERGDQSLDQEVQPMETEEQPIVSEDQTMESEDQTLESEDQTLENEAQTLESEDQTVGKAGQPIKSTDQPVVSEDQPSEVCVTTEAVDGDITIEVHEHVAAENAVEISGEKKSDTITESRDSAPSVSNSDKVADKQTVIESEELMAGEETHVATAVEMKSNKIQAAEDEQILVMVEEEQEEGAGGNIEVSNQEIVVVQGQDLQVIQGSDIEVVQSEDIVQTNVVFEQEAEEPRLQNDSNQAEMEQITIIETGVDHETVKTVKREEVETSGRLPRNIQILDENGSAILLMDKDSESDDSDLEDREFTVIVDEDASDEENDDEDINIDKLERLPLGDKSTFEGETIEDLLAQFESESKNRAVSCPSCKKCFVSAHFLSIHVNNKSTLCDLCNMQCCTAPNLRNHKNLDCDLSKRKRNIDLIAQETALLGRKPIEPEKYYNLPIDSSDEENEHEGPQRKITRCPECGILVTNLARHKALKHDTGTKVITPEADLEVVRCKQPGCDIFFNNTDELAEHQKRDHSDQVRLACGMGGCNGVFDSRGSLRKHRAETHPELEEFKPVDLEPDDPDREAELTVACPVCERKFKHKNTCTVHIKVHHLGWTKRKMFECPDCMKGFDNKKNMELHREAIHLGIRTICPLCDKPVTRLDLHVRMVHTDLPEWPCPDCGKKFKRKFDLNRHRVTVHLGVRNFPCDLCGKRFADMKDMTRHKNAVHYGMKIKWNSKKHKEERKRRKLELEKKLKYSGGQHRRDRLDKYGRRGNVNIPVEFIDTGSGSALHIEEGSRLEGNSVMLDPVLQSQIGTNQEEDREARVLLQADNDHSGGFRFVVLHEGENENDIEIEEEAETHIILEPED